MSTGLENKLNQILTEKETYLTSGNIKKDVTILGVTGTLEGVTGEEINITPSTSQQVITPTTGKNAITKATVSAVTSSIDANIIQSNIKAGVTILGVTGNVEPDKPDQTKTCTPTTSQQVIQPDTGYELASVTVNGVTSAIDSNITAGNIKSGVSILGVSGSYSGIDTSDANATAGDILSSKTAYVNGSKLTGTYTWAGDSNYSTCLDLTTQILATYVPPTPVDVIGTLTTKLPDPSGLYKFKVEDFIDFIDDIIDYNTEQQSNDDIIAIYMRNSFSYNFGNIWSGDGYDTKYPHLNSLSARTDYYDNIYWTEFKGLLQDLRTKYEPSDVPFIQCAFNYNGQTGGYTYTEFYIQSTGITGSGTTFDFTW